ncbi:hypothetical protein CI105_00295 [Candidatus Izimaplasma bacterium ZiA1]|uniref:MATE family efflux transporter n=1 Tax=Candidatus Izimoplasma sp. ZiA1 TaxID=2024899 RepID=UPI000BAA8579|nr:hypothetical protein CI105_00295 [Candidatus Izimaplasma bacterium ZiA1]
MKTKKDLTKGNILSSLLFLAVPTLLTSLVQMTYNLTDMFWVGKVGNIGLDATAAIAAVGTAGYYTWLGFGLILLAKIGTSVMVSQSAGADDDESVKGYASTGLVLMAILAVIYMTLGYFGSELFIGLFGIEEDIIVVDAVSYVRIVSMFGFGFFFVNLFNGIYDGLGKTLNTFYITSIGLVLNIILDPIFILVFKMGVNGAAIATVISQLVILSIYIYIYSSRFKPFKINMKEQFSKSKLFKIIKIGMPVGLQSILFTLISLKLAALVADFGKPLIATQRIGSQIEALAWMIASGFQVALAAFVGQNLGAKKYDRIRNGYFTSLKLLIPYGIFVNILLFVFAEQLFSIFINDPVTVSYGKEYLQILSVSQMFMIVELGTAGAFNGLGKSYAPSIVGITFTGLRIPFSMLFVTGFGVTAIWWVISVSSIVKGVLLVTWFLLLLIRMKKVYNFNIVEKSETL